VKARLLRKLPCFCFSFFGLVMRMFLVVEYTPLSTSGPTRLGWLKLS
jgi:hypothetical protein